MKKKSTIFSILKVLGVSPQVVFLLLLGILLSGMILGFLITNSSNKKSSPDYKIKKTQKVIIPEKPTSNEAVIKDEIKKEDSLIITDDTKKETTPYNLNKLAFSTTSKNPMIAIVVDDMGVDMIRSNKMLGIPDIYTFSFLTYAPNLQSQINFAKTKGKEVMLHVPMEALNNIYDYGPEVLSTKHSRSENLELLNTMLNRVSGYIGINNHMGSKFTSDLPLLSGVIEELSKKGLMFLDSKTIASSKADEIVEHIKLPYASRDIFIDDSNKIEDIKKSLISLENIAKKRGYAIAICHPRDNTIKVLQDWLPTLKEKGITSVPLSYIIDKVNN